MKKINNSGFTLVEILAAMVILSIIMMVAIPNVIGILTNSKNNNYVDDAKKFISTAEYKLKTKNYQMPTGGACVVIALKVIDNSEFENSPNQVAYNKDKSFIVINKENYGSAVGGTGGAPVDESINSYSYSIVLVDSKGKGVYAENKDDLYNKKPSELVSTNILVNTSPTAGSEFNISISGVNKKVCNNVQMVYKD